MRRRAVIALSIAAGLLIAAEAPAPSAAASAQTPAASRGWARQPGCAWRNYWSDANHSALTLEWIKDADSVGLTMVSDAFAGWPAGAPQPVQLAFGGATEPVTVSAHATTAGAYAVLELPFTPEVEQGFARDSTLTMTRDGKSYLNLDMAGTAAAITAVRQCPTQPEPDFDELDMPVDPAEPGAP